MPGNNLIAVLAALPNSRGVDLSDLRGRQVSSSDFEKFDYVIAMDRLNYNDLTSVCPRGSEEKLHLLMDFASHVRGAGGA